MSKRAAAGAAPKPTLAVSFGQAAPSVDGVCAAKAGRKTEKAARSFRRFDKARSRAYARHYGSNATTRSAAQPAVVDWAERATYGALLGARPCCCSGSRMRIRPVMPFWAPWDFSPSIYLATALTLYWYLARPGAVAARGSFVALAAGSVILPRSSSLIYGVLQTRFEYWSQHMFFLNRAQNVVMHDLGPFLIALGWPGATIKRGMPHRVRRIIESRHVIGADARPAAARASAVFLFVGLFYFWLIPRGAFPRHDRSSALRGDELEHDPRRPPVLVPGPRSAAEAAGARLLWHARWRWRSA